MRRTVICILLCLSVSIAGAYERRDILLVEDVCANDSIKGLSDSLSSVPTKDQQLQISDEQKLDERDKNDSLVIKNLKDPRFVKRGETKYILQDRYLEQGKTFSNWLFDRMDVGIMSGYSRMAPRSEHEVKPGVPLGIYLKYNLNRLHAVRLSYDRTRFEVEGYGSELVHQRVDLDYMLNLSSYLYGHNAQRVMSVLAVAGGGYISTKFRGNIEPVWKVQGGLNFDFKLSPSSHLFVEPYMAVATDQIDHSVGSNAHRWDVMYGVKAGVGVNFNTKNTSLEDVNYNGNLFWEFKQGLTLFSADEIDIKESMGTSYALSIGKWLDPYVGVRLSGTVRDYCHVMETSLQKNVVDFMVVPPYETKARTVMASGRLELLLDVLNFFRGYRNQRHPTFAWQLSVGGEFGFIGKRVLRDQDGMEASLKTSYAGFVAGSQFLFAPDHNTALFVEPCVLVANYSHPYTNAPDHKAKFSDRVFGVNVGVRVSHPTKKDRSIAMAEEGGKSNVFKPRNFGGVVLGSIRGEKMKTIQADDKMPLSVGLCVGREFAPWTAFKLQVEYQRMHTASMQQYGVSDGTVYARPALFNEDYTLVNAKLAYMLSLSNLLQGYDSSRKLNVFLELGPSYVHVLKKEYSLYSKEMAGGKNPKPIIEDEQGEGGSFAVLGGLVCDLRLGKKIHVQLEPYGQVLTKPLLYGGLSGRLNKDFVMGVDVGVTYNF